MVWAIVVLVLVVLVAALVKISPGSAAWPVEPRRPLSPVEQKLYWKLVRALPDNPVLAQVQLSRMIKVKRVLKWRSWFNKLVQKSADFVVCNKDFSVAAVIELDDSTHDRVDRRKADADKDAALNAAGIRVIRWNVKAMPDEQAIQKAIAAPQNSA